MNNLIQNKLFYMTTSTVNPPFKNGLYMEEYFLRYACTNDRFYDHAGRLYIPALWTNFQVEKWPIPIMKNMQRAVIQFIKTHPNEKGYFTVIQHDDGPFLKLPPNTIIYGACNGHIPLPLIYEDESKTLTNLAIYGKPFSERNILCSFVGSITQNVRNICITTLAKIPGFDFTVPTKGWTLTVDKSDQSTFIEKTLDSKFALAPRGYGRSSFRFFEIFQLGCIPIYVWDRHEWLPYKTQIDYSKICISIHVSKIDRLPDILEKIDEPTYNTMKLEYEKIKHMFELEFMCQYISGHMSSPSSDSSECVSESSA